MKSESVRLPGRLIVVVGFMGSGKTTVARELARALKCPAIDLDEMIAQREQRSPAEIIEQSGEDEFRRIESETLRRVLLEESVGVAAHILALGGGTWTLRSNRDLINQHQGTVVWLDAPFELCWQRIEDALEARPLGRSREVAERLFAERRPVYELANVRITASAAKTVAETAGEVAVAAGLADQRTKPLR